MSQNDGQKMRMIYGVNQADACQAFALGDASELIQERLREIGTRMVRLFLYDKGAPDPVTPVADLRLVRGGGPERRRQADDYVRENA